MTEITHILKYRTSWRYMGFCRKIADWQWDEENTICNKAIDMQDSAIIMEELVISLSGGFVNGNPGP